METEIRTSHFAFRYTTYAPRTTMTPHCDGSARVSIVLWGALRETAAGGNETATSASVVLKPGDLQHANEFGPGGAGVLSITPVRAGRLLGGRYAWVHAGSAVAASTQLIFAIRAGLRGPELDSRAQALIHELERAGSADDSPAPAWLRRVHEQLSGDYAGAVSVESIARSAAVHPVHLTRCFRRHYGRPVTAHLRALRVRAAADMLATSGAPLARIALEAGFSDQSHMCRVFRSEVGVTPGAYRRTMSRPVFDPFNT